MECCTYGNQFFFQINSNYTKLNNNSRFFDDELRKSTLLQYTIKLFYKLKSISRNAEAKRRLDGADSDSIK